MFYLLEEPSMPLHVPPISRRSFLAQSAAAAAGLLVTRTAWADEQAADPNLFALLSDTHVPNHPKIGARGVNMTENLQRVVAQLVEMKRKPAGVIINGDCAYLKGLPDDYVNLARLVQPLSEAGLPLHLTMGNHDDRGPLYQALAAQRPTDPPVESKHVSVIESPHANWLLLDSLYQVNVVTGELGAEQLAWIEQELDARQDKPAIVVAHHNPQFTPPADGAVWGGLKDSAALFELLESRKQVKAFIYGHTHNWAISKRGRLHLINLPPVAYVFAQEKPNGWVEAQTHADGLNLQLHAHDTNHPQHGQKVELTWA